MKRQNQSGFAHAGAILLLIIILAVIGGGGYYIWHKNKDRNDRKTTADSSSTAAEKLQAYKRSTTVPATWKKYTDDKYKFSFSYAPTWKVDTWSAETSKGGHAKGEVYGVQIFSGDVAYMNVSVFDTNLADALAAEKTTLSNFDAPLSVAAASLTFDGHAALKFDLPASQENAEKTVYLVESGNRTYAVLLFAHPDNTKNLDTNTLTAFESLKLN